MKRSISAISIISLITITSAAPALSQSGRGRPKVPQPSSSTTPPPPVINVPAAAAVTRQEQSGTLSRFVLRNGITVIISEHHSTPIAAAVAYFKAGTQDEPWSMSAVARLTARMILKGTVLRPGDQAVSDLRALGASFESSTSFDGASYSMVAPSEKLKEAMSIQADMLQHSALEGDALRREIQFVIEEQKTAGGVALERGLALSSQPFSTRPFTAVGGDQALSSIDDPAAYSMAQLVHIAFSGGPPADMDLLRSVTREQLVEFYRSHYRPENLIIAIAGDISTFNTLIEIQQLYGDFGVSRLKHAGDSAKAPEGARPKPSVVRASAPASTAQQQSAKPQDSNPEKVSPGKPSFSLDQATLRYSSDRADISQSIVSVGFHVPGADSKDWPAIEVLTALAGQGRASRFNRYVVDSQMVANRIESTYLAFAGAGLLTTQMWSAKDSREGSSIDKAESALFKELDKLRRETPAEGELARAKMLLEKRFFDETASYLGRARALARAEAAGIGLRVALDYRTRIRSVSADDVRRAAARYLTLPNTSIYEYQPFSAEARTFDSASFATTVVAWAPGFAQLVEDAAVQAPDPNATIAPVAQGTEERSPERQAMVESVQPLPIKDFSTLNGPKAFVREDHSQQTVTIALLFQGGRLTEDTATSGTTELMLRSILYGTQRRPFPQVAQELEQLGADVSIVIEPDFFGFIVSALSRNAERALKILRDMIEDPAFRDDDIARARLGQIAAIRDARDSRTRPRELILQSLFSEHPYSLPPHGREEVISALTSEKIHDWYSRVVTRQLPLAIIVGDTAGSALVSSQIAAGFKRREVDAAIQVRTPQPGAGEKIEQRRAEQTILAVGFAGPKAESGDLIPVNLLESAMNGEGGRLRKELRGKQNLV
ncbi:MAG TPA: insulinase family protein, partial [Blastocatellia bacterium]|nr:insulinase family protein [Blastocatellia bacterium]